MVSSSLLCCNKCLCFTFRCLRLLWLRSVTAVVVEAPVVDALMMRQTQRRREREREKKGTNEADANRPVVGGASGGEDGGSVGKMALLLRPFSFLRCDMLFGHRAWCTFHSQQISALKWSLIGSLLSFGFCLFMHLFLERHQHAVLQHRLIWFQERITEGGHCCDPLSHRMFEPFSLVTCWNTVNLVQQ